MDKQRFFEANNASFMIPKKFEYNPVRRDETESLVHKSVLDELEVRKRKLKERLATLKGTIQILRKQIRWVGGLGQISTFAFTR